HDFANSASLTVANAARALSRFLSNVANNSSRDFGGFALGGFPPGGLMSSPSCVSVISVQLGIFATCPASQPSVGDFGCGFQSNFSNGTRSSALRVFAIS